MSSLIPKNTQQYLFTNLPFQMGETAHELLRNIHAPDPMIGMSLTGVAAAMTQALADVELPTGQIRPCALNFLVIAESGERKTTIDNLVFAPVFAYDKAKLLAYEAANEEYKRSMRRWIIKDKSYHRKYDKAEGNKEEEAYWLEKIEQHNKNEPPKPRLRRLLRQDITDRAWMDALNGDGESIVLSTDEGEVLFKGRAMNQLGRLNKAYDGAALLTLDLAKGESVVVMNPRLSINIMTQHAVLKEYLKKRGDVARGSGHWARYLVAWPNSTQGWREVHEGDLVWEEMPKFHARIEELLARYDERIASGSTTREVLKFTDEAKRRWVDLARETEAMIRPGGYLNDINDFASKVMEILGRMAAVFHYFNGDEGKIGLDTLNRAFGLLRWHVEEFKCLFSSENYMPEAHADAMAVKDYLLYRAPFQWTGSEKHVRKNLLLRNNVLPSARRLNAALELLEAHDEVRVIVEPSTRTRWIALNPQRF